jgi:hypothetical protein
MSSRSYKILALDFFWHSMMGMFRTNRIIRPCNFEYLSKMSISLNYVDIITLGEESDLHDLLLVSKAGNLLHTRTIVFVIVKPFMLCSSVGLRISLESHF